MEKLLKGKKGTTLLELLIVTAIIGVMTAAFIPEARRMKAQVKNIYRSLYELKAADIKIEDVSGDYSAKTENPVELSDLQP